MPLTRSMPDGNQETYAAYRGVLDGYDAGIAHIDHRIGDLLAELERLGIRDETAVIVSADHGESIGELGMYFEHGNACEGTTRVPLIVDWPGLPGGGSQHDIAAKRPEVLAALDHLLLEWTLHHSTGPAAAPDPFALRLAESAGPDLYCPRKKLEQHLTDLGRDDQPADLRRRRDIPAPLHLEDATRA